MSQLFQIHEDDLLDLERTLPDMANAMMENLSPKTKTQLRRMKTILSNVRWSYGPPSHVETVRDDSLDGAGHQDS